MSTKIQSFLSATIRVNPRPNPQTIDSKQNPQDRQPPKSRHPSPATTHHPRQIPVTFSTTRSYP
jgi:hypothetical protein